MERTVQKMTSKLHNTRQRHLTRHNGIGLGLFLERGKGEKELKLFYLYYSNDSPFQILHAFSRRLYKLLSLKKLFLSCYW